MRRLSGTIYLSLSIILLVSAPVTRAAPVDAPDSAIEYSLCRMLGNWMQPFFAPLVLTGRCVLHLIPSMAAREVAVSALATVYGGWLGEHALGTALYSSWSITRGFCYLALFVYCASVYCHHCGR